LFKSNQIAVTGNDHAGEVWPGRSVTLILKPDCGRDWEHRAKPKIQTGKIESEVPDLSSNPAVA